ncbi:uncharacterized protein LOC144243986 [Crocuta crocuta]
MQVSLGLPAMKDEEIKVSAHSCTGLFCTQHPHSSPLPSLEKMLYPCCTSAGPGLLEGLETSTGAVPGPRQRKTKTRAEETAAGAPPEKPGQKARASRPRCPAAGGLARPPRSVPSALAARCASRPLRLPSSSRPPPKAALAPTPSPPLHSTGLTRRLSPRAADW